MKVGSGRPAVNAASTVQATKLCEAMKAGDKITVFTVGFGDGINSAAKNMLIDCATEPDMYYDVSQAVQLNSVFSSIAQNLANLRISK